MKLLICGYRDWALKLYLNLWKDANKENGLLVWYTSEKDRVIQDADRYSVDFIIFVGWSWIVGKDVLDKYKCLCLHPSPLPKYRGGSPLQHQIINGEKESAITLFEMTENIDDGPILGQVPLSLEGSLDDIFSRLSVAGAGLIYDCLIENNTWDNRKPQDESLATTFRRRKPKESQLQTENFQNWSCERLYDFIRCLATPYPNAFIEDENGDRLYFEKVRLEKKNG